MGLVLVIGVYILIAIAAVAIAVTLAKRHGKNRWLWAAIAALAVYLPVFWDHIPTILVHKYYCETEAALFVYKTAEQWQAENPGIGGSLTPQRNPYSGQTGDNNNNVVTYVLNQRLRMVVRKSGPIPVNRWRHEQSLVDIKTDQVLGTNIDFSTGYGSLATGSDTWQVLKFWLFNPHCNDGKVRDSRFHQFRYSFPGVNK